MNIPVLDLKAQFNSMQSELLEAVTRVSVSQQCILGPEVTAFEQEIASYLNVGHTIAVSSGTDALLMALMALDCGPDTEVIVPTFSFFATAGCVVRSGARPVFVDVDPDTFCISPDAIRSAITTKTRAIIPVHLYGRMADMNQILQIANDHGVKVIEDAAQAIATTDSSGRSAGTLGDVGCFSFYPTKNLGAFGDAGLITTNDGDLAHHLRIMRNHGMEPIYNHQFIGGNFRMDGIQGAVLRAKLPYLRKWNAARRRNACLYEELLVKSGVSTGSSTRFFTNNNRVILPHRFSNNDEDFQHTFHQYTIRIEKRDELKDFLESRSIGSAIYYPLSFHQQPCFASLSSSNASYPYADALSTTVLSLPIYPELSESDIYTVVSAIAEFANDQYQAEPITTEFQGS